MLPHPPPTQGVALIGQLDWPQNLYIAQALHEAGWQVRILTEGIQPKEFKGWLDVHHVNAGDERMLSDMILQLAQNPDVRWILPLDEAAIATCHRTLTCRDKLLPQIPDADLSMLQKKSVMARFALSLGIPVPDWFHVQGPDEALHIADGMGYPVVLKGEQGNGGSQVVICDDARALRDGLQKLKHHDTVLQRHVSGRNWACGGFFHRGVLTHIHGYEIVEQHPPGLGAATFIRHEQSPAMVQALEAMGSAMTWTGYMQADFIRDDHGTFWFLEINPRPWGSITAAQAAGTPIFSPLIDTLAGRVPQPWRTDDRGWSAHVFPKPLLQLAYKRRGLRMLQTLLSPAFWRGAPRTSSNLMRYFFKVMYWYWTGPRDRKANHLAPKALGSSPRV